MNDSAHLSSVADRIRARAVLMTNLKHSGHLGSSLSMADILAVLFDSVLIYNPELPSWPGRDRFILSKGHAAAGVYAVMAEKGFFPAERLGTYYCDDGYLSGHISHHVPGVEFSTGSLGHGLPVGVGMALAGKRARKPYRVFVLLSDGDCNEGSTWEAVMFAAQQKLDNLTVIVDYNRIQALGRTKDIIDLEPFADKWKVFGWEAREIDGHDFSEIDNAFSRLPLKERKPGCVIARTVKGKGISRIEGTVSSHYRCIPDEDIEACLEELGVKRADCF